MLKRRENISRILRTLPREKAFYFFTSIGNYTGESASSLKEFMEKINEVNLKSLEFHLHRGDFEKWIAEVKSLEFHLHRGDFEKWIAEVLEDNELAEEIGKLQKLNLTGDVLRNYLYKTVSKHYYNLISGSMRRYI